MDWQSLGSATGTVLLGASCLQALGATYVGRRRLRRADAEFARRQQNFDQRLQAICQWARAAKPVFKAWSGTRPLRVGAIVDEAADCKSYYLVPVDGRPLPRFEPGQHLTFKLPVDPRQKPMVRCYSLSDRQREDYYRITVKLAQPPAPQSPQTQRDVPPGVGSTYFHTRVQVGSTLDVQAPQGSFFLDPTDRLPLVFVGGGIGITPLVSMANSIVHAGSQQTAYLFGGFANSREHPFRDYLRDLTAAHDNLHYNICYSRPTPSDNLGRDYHHRGRVDINTLRQVLPSSNYRYYVCGPPGMMESLVPAIRDWGVPDGHIHFEAFGPASVQGLSHSAAAADLAATPCTVEMALSGAHLAWDGSYASLLECAEAKGAPLDYGCRAGNCGQCLVTVRSGEFAHLKQPGLPLDGNECLTCIGVPHGDVVLEA